MTYAAALFCQLFDQERRRTRCLPRAIRAAMQRLSPTLPAQDLRTYTHSLHSTMVVNGALRPDWRDCVHREHP